MFENILQIKLLSLVLGNSESVSTATLWYCGSAVNFWYYLRHFFKYLNNHGDL